MGEPVLVDVSLLDDSGLQAKALIAFVDLVADLAVLAGYGAGGDLWEADEHAAERFDKLIANRQSARLDLNGPPIGAPYRAHIFTIERQ